MLIRPLEWQNWWKADPKSRSIIGGALSWSESLMLQLRRAASLMLVMCLATACDGGHESLEQCSIRFARLAGDIPIFAGEVRSTLTFDLSKMDEDQIEQLTVNGLGGRGRPILMAANQDTDASRKEFSQAPVSPRGLLRIARSSVLFRVSTGPHRSVSDAVREGCRLIPDAQLKYVALTLG